MKETIEAFFSSGAYAVIGVSDNRAKFGNRVYRMMRDREFVVYPVNPRLNTVEGDKCYPDIDSLPEDVRSIVTVVPPGITESLIQACEKKGIRGIWMQPGSESDKAIDAAAQLNINVISKQCILMFLEPVKSVHALHRWFSKLFGKYPK